MDLEAQPLLIPAAEEDSTAKVNSMRPCIGSTGLYALELDGGLWVPITVTQQVGPDEYTVVLHFEQWRQRNPRRRWRFDLDPHFVRGVQFFGHHDDGGHESVANLRVHGPYSDGVGKHNGEE